MRGARFPPAGGGSTGIEASPPIPIRRAAALDGPARRGGRDIADRSGERPDMRGPRPVALTGAKRRALRVIRRTLTEEDPGLSVAAEDVRPRPGRCVRRTTWIYVAMSVVVPSSAASWLTRHDRSGRRHAAVHSGRPPVHRRVRASVAVGASRALGSVRCPAGTGRPWDAMPRGGRGQRPASGRRQAQPRDQRRNLLGRGGGRQDSGEDFLGRYPSTSSATFIASWTARSSST